jgi:hypothetical protein
MKAPEWAITKTVRLSRRLAVNMTCGPAGLVCEWDPAPPTSLRTSERRRYRRARDHLLIEMKDRLGLGGAILVIEA